MLPSRFRLLGLLAVTAVCGNFTRSAGAAPHWVTAWATATLAETPGPETPHLEEATVRQNIRVTLAGARIRLRLGNYFGEADAVLGGARVAVRQGATIDPATWHPLTFGGHPSVTIPAKAEVSSDALDLPVSAGAILAIDLYVEHVPPTLTGHSAARATTVVVPGNRLASPPSPAAAPEATCTRWYFLSAVDVDNADGQAIAILGDSITDGYGCPPDSYARWPDGLARRLETDPATRDVAVLNLGIGGNRLLHDGLGPRGLSRLDRDIFAQHGVTTLIVSIGVNDLGGRTAARAKHLPYARADDVIGGLKTVAAEAHQHGLRVIGATITPFRGHSYYVPDAEADRETVNDWIRHGGAFDAVIDFDAAMRDPAQPDRLAPRFDHDHLHPSVAGYAAMAQMIDLALFARSPVPAAAAH